MKQYLRVLSNLVTISHNSFKGSWRFDFKAFVLPCDPFWSNLFLGTNWGKKRSKYGVGVTVIHELFTLADMSLNVGYSEILRPKLAPAPLLGKLSRFNGRENKTI